MVYGQVVKKTMNELIRNTKKHNNKIRVSIYSIV